MNSTVVQLLYTLETTLLFSVVTIGVYLSFRVLRFPDLTAEGGFGLSAILGGMAYVSTGSPWIALIVSVLAGVAAGLTTAALANLVKLPTILASILTMMMCFSVGLLVAGQPSRTLPDDWMLGSMLSFLDNPLAVGIVGMALSLAVIVVGVVSLLRTGSGFMLRIRGENPNLARELGHSLLVWDMVGLAIANGIIGLAAALLSQRSGYASINMGRGMAISALAAIMLGEAIFPTRRLAPAFLACIGGTLVMQLVRLLALNLGMPDGGLDLVTSLMVIAFCWLARSNGVFGHNVLEKIRI